MCKCIDFTAQLAEKFPWNNMTNEVDGTIFSGAFSEENELFWVRLNEALELHKESAPLRCAEILDFIGRFANYCGGDITLSHYRNTDFAGLVLQYYEEAVKQGAALSVMQVLILKDITFEARYQPKLYERSRNVLAAVNVKLIYVSNAEVEKQYVHGYHYLWRSKEAYEKFVSYFGL